MLGLFKPFIVTGLTLFLLSWLLPTVGYLDWITLALMSVVLTILQKVAKPLLNLLFLPFNLVTFGLFSILINIFLLWLATYLVPGFSIEPMSLFGINLGYWSSIWVISIMISFIQGLFKIVI